MRASSLLVAGAMLAAVGFGLGMHEYSRTHIRAARVFAILGAVAMATAVGRCLGYAIKGVRTDADG